MMMLLIMIIFDGSFINGGLLDATANGADDASEITVVACHIIIYTVGDAGDTVDNAADAVAITDDMEVHSVVATEILILMRTERLMHFLIRS